MHRPILVDNILELIGNTPLVRLSRIAPTDCAAVWGKCEMLNPGGSVKDRIALAMVEAAEREGRNPSRSEHAGRADLGQHRHRARARQRGQGLSTDPHDAREHEPRAAKSAQSLRRSDRAHARGSHDGGRGLFGGRAVPQAQPRHAAAVSQPGEPCRASTHDGAGDPRADAGPEHRRVRRWLWAPAAR